MAEREYTDLTLFIDKQDDTWNIAGIPDVFRNK